jgi:dihydrofolate reductase
MFTNPKITLLMAMSINGMIADLNDQVPWTQPIWKNYFEFVKSCGALIVGHRTYELMATDSDLARLSSVQIAVLTSKPKLAAGNVAFFAKAEEIVEYFQHKKIKQIVLGGGAKTNLFFLEQNLIDEVVLDIDPVFMPQGKMLFEKDMTLLRRAQLKEVKTLGGSCVRLHYQFVNAGI